MNNEMDLAVILTSIGTAITIIGFVYGFLRSFKEDINNNIDRLEKRMDQFDHRMDRFEVRMDSFETKVISLEERMFWMATGKKLEDAILEERLKQKKINP